MNKKIYIIILGLLIARIGAAATSSLASSSDYVFTIPNITNTISGKVMGDTPAYRILRSEDIAFIGEALCELQTIFQAFDGNLYYHYSIPVVGWDSWILKKSSSFPDDFGQKSEPISWISLFITPINSFTNESGRAFYVDGNKSLISEQKQIDNNAGWIGKALELQEEDIYRFSTNDLQLLKNRVPRISTLTNFFAAIKKGQSLNVGIHYNTYGNFSPNEYKSITHKSLFTQNPPRFNYDINSETHSWVIDSPENSTSTITNSQSSAYTATYSSIAIEEKVAPLGIDTDEDHEAEEQYSSVVTTTKEFSETYSIANPYAYESVVSNLIYFGNFYHIEEVKCVGLFSVEETLTASQSLTWYSNGDLTNSVSAIVTTNFYIMVPLQIQKITSGRNSNLLRWEIPSCKNFKELAQDIYSKGMFEFPQTFAQDPQFPSKSDVNQTGSITRAYYNRSSAQKRFSISSAGILFLWTPKYHATFSD